MLSAELRLADHERSDVLYCALLKDARSAGAGGPLPLEARRDAMFLRGSLDDDLLPLPRGAERGALVVRALGLAEEVALGVHHVLERWDGRGEPNGLRSSSTPIMSRVVAVAEAMELARAAGEREDVALEAASGSELDPELVRLAISLGRGGLWDALEDTDEQLARLVLDCEPAPFTRVLDGPTIDAVAGTFADIVDGRTPSLGRHSRAVARLAEATARAIGLPAPLVVDVRRAALLHDIGTMPISPASLETAQPLAGLELAQVAAHPRLGYEILSRCPLLARPARLVAGHHDPLDGHHRFSEVEGEVEGLAARIVALSDRFGAMTASRAHREALGEEAALALLDGIAQEPVARVALRGLRRALADARGGEEAAIA